jgi:5-methylcytosine-specific restriction enzyme B
MTHINTLIGTFLKEYQYDFANKSLTAIITKELPSELSKLITYPNKLKIKGSVGRIHPADIPWVALMDTDITQTTREGYYIELLFSPHTQTMTLGLCIGWVYCEQKYRNSLERVEMVTKAATFLASKIEQPKSGFPKYGFKYENPVLGAQTDLSIGYEYSSNFTKKYTLQNLFTEDIIHDINYLLEQYYTIKFKIGVDFWTH